MDVIADLEAEQERLESLLGALDDEQWQSSSAAAGWSVADVVLHELEVEGPANKLPDRIEIDVAELGIHQHVTASEIPLPEGFKMITPPDTTVVSVEPSKTERLLEEAAAEGAVAEQVEPEIVGKPAEEVPPEGAPE